MGAKYIASQHKHPETQTQTKSPQFIQHRNDYIAWAIRILDEQRHAMASHVQRVQTSLPWQSSGGTDETESAVMHESTSSGFMPPKIRRFFG